MKAIELTVLSGYTPFGWMEVCSSLATSVVSRRRKKVEVSADAMPVSDIREKSAQNDNFNTLDDEKGR
jgi:hypothetical protein